MLWRNRWTLLTVSNQIIRPLPSASFHYHSWPFPSGVSQNKKISCNNSDPEFPQKGKQLLNGQIICSTLSSCPSDLISLSFFMWCAQQPNYFHDVAAFDCMVSVVRRLTEQHKTVKGIVLELETVGCIMKAKVFLLLLRIYWHGGMYDMVFEVYEQMISCGFAANTFARNVVMDVLFKIGQTDKALKVLKDTQAPNFLTFNIALLHLSKSNDVDLISHVLKVMLRMQYYPNARSFEILLNCFCKMNRFAEAYQVLGLMISFGIAMSSKVWTILINGFCKQHRLLVASNLLKKMIETDCSPNVVTYTTLFKAFMESKMIADAFGLLDTMVSRGQNPDIILYNVLIDCLSKAGMYQDAIDVFLNLSKQNIAPDSYTLSSLLSTICLSKKFNLLSKLVCGHVVDADLMFCNALLSSFCKAGSPSLAVELYNYMVDRGFSPDKYTFCALLSGLCGARRIVEAINVYRGIVMSCDDVDAHIHTVLIDGLIKIGKYHIAIKMFKNAINEKYPLDSVSYTVGMCGLLKGGRTQELFVKKKIVKWSIGCYKR
ncbi:putative pentatricopeptide repeat-containing protein At1g16830 [Neltuma alba]|uniref:putative pentatricopeptide repeat-containing protein At1g16830 n=1 Tax=Neltuma alba TaxID=207710 RepID=UPI0010A51BC8|nr:putative pentatricopeptide repeat-containing protein At1g16830 [Prosopis alba]